MKKLLFGLLITCSLMAKAQVYNNEWIDYSKTYYKFKVGKTGLYRIPQSLLTSAGLGNTPAEYIQLWRNGVQVPIYTSVTSGTLSSSDYIEFWGLMNDGKPDKDLYRDPNNQLNDKWSLETDSSTYFLTVNPAGNNLRLQNTPNPVAENTLPVEPYFMYTLGQYYREKINAGYAVNVGEYLYSSSYDKAEGWSSADIVSSSSGNTLNIGTKSISLSNLSVYSGINAPAPKFKIAVSGNALNPRRYKVKINADSVIGNEVDFFNATTDTTSFSLSTIVSNTANVTVSNITFCNPVACPATDLMDVHYFEITYPRQFNFGGAKNFEFMLPATATGNFLQITNFSYGTSTPVLYDLSNGARYVADLSVPSALSFALPPSATDRNLVLVSEEATNLNTISSLQTRNFINYTASANQGDYLIITNQILTNGSNGSNPIDDYRSYRSSSQGGAFNAKVYYMDELVDQFGFGIKRFPLAIRNFIRYARINYASRPRQVFIIGKGVNYVSQRGSEANANMNNLDLVPPFGFPASDILYTAEPGSSYPEIPIGRLSAISSKEVSDYLKKVKEFEQAQANISPNISDRAWMKNVVHIIGASEPGLEDLLRQNMDNYGQIISDTLFGGDVSLFSKSSTNTVDQLDNTYLQNLFTQGISLITYFGHSSSTTLEFNLDNPENYNNVGKYPLFIGLGCNAGNFFNFNTLRLQTRGETLSENYVLAPEHGTIGFIASTYFGIVHYLDIWASRAYNQISVNSYGKTIGEIMQATAEDVFNFTTQEDFYSRCNVEQSELNGDPAIHLNSHAKPDYVVEPQMVKTSSDFISVSDASFKFASSFLNIGKSNNKNIVVEVKRQFPDQSIKVIYRDTILGIRYTDSIAIDIPINPLHDKGLNKITVTVDADNAVDELYETNNSVTKDITIYEDAAHPVYPYNYAIINQQNIKFVASTANPFSESKQYRMEIDTTENFNSPGKITSTVTSSGGVMEFNPSISFTDSTVYYWRVAPEVSNGKYAWSNASFVYLVNSDVGFNQSHLFQHLKSDAQEISLDSFSRKWKYGTVTQNLFLRMGTWITSGATQAASLSVAVNTVPSIRLMANFSTLGFNVFDPVTFKPLPNHTVVPYGSGPNGLGLGLYGSIDNNPPFADEPRYFNFEYRYTDTASRRKMMDFMRDVIPDGAYVVVRNFTLDPAYGYPNAWASDWAADTTLHGSGQSLYHYLKNAGFSGIDSFYKVRPWGFVYKKNDPSFTPRWIVGEGMYDNPTLSVDCPTPDTVGHITSPQFGPAKQWKELRWAGSSLDNNPGDNPLVDIIGINNAGAEDTVMRAIGLTQQVLDISSINAQQYPYLKLHLRNSDTTNFTPYQLRYWRLTNEPAPEGAVAPNIYFSMKDTLDVAEPLEFKMAFKNISKVNFTDSLKMKLVVTDKNNVTHVFPEWKQRSLNANDTLNVRYQIDTRQLTGINSMYLEVNPDNDQLEQYHFNNFIYKNFYVRKDTLHPLMDVTFDNIHILNHDIVSAKPNIVIKLKDESKWFLMDDNSTIKVQVQFPDGSIHPYAYDNDTLQFSPAQKTANNNDNSASAVFKPYFTQDGEYQLIITGKDMSQNQAGNVEYRVQFQVFNKPMISNMLNYPNPFTTSTAFVFTVTGVEVPQNIRIQILTVTGKVVREITKEELGPIHIGRNITEYKWDGTDQYGQKLGNGVYLYRVITNLNGKSLDKFTADGDDTDKYFTKGYGKMYLMR